MGDAATATLLASSTSLCIVPPPSASESRRVRTAAADRADSPGCNSQHKFDPGTLPTRRPPARNLVGGAIRLAGSASLLNCIDDALRSLDEAIVAEETAEDQELEELHGFRQMALQCDTITEGSDWNHREISGEACASRQAGGASAAVGTTATLWLCTALSASLRSRKSSALSQWFRVSHATQSSPPLEAGVGAGQRCRGAGGQWSFPSASSAGVHRGGHSKVRWGIALASPSPTSAHSNLEEEEVEKCQGLDNDSSTVAAAESVALIVGRVVRGRVRTNALHALYHWKRVTVDAAYLARVEASAEATVSQGFSGQHGLAVLDGHFDNSDQIAIVEAENRWLRRAVQAEHALHEALMPVALRMHQTQYQALQALATHAACWRALHAPPRSQLCLHGSVAVIGVEPISEQCLYGARLLACVLLQGKLKQMGWAWRNLTGYSDFVAARCMVLRSLSCGVARQSLRDTLMRTVARPSAKAGSAGSSEQSADLHNLDVVPPQPLLPGFGGRPSPLELFAPK